MKLELELAALIADHVRAIVDPIRDQVAALEARPVPRDGKDGADGVVPAQWDTRLAALEAAGAGQVTDETIAREVEALVRRELLGALPPALKMQKRIIRDQHGKIARVIEEPEAR